MSVINLDVIVISSDDDDGDGETNVDEGLESEDDGDYRELDGQESDKEEEVDVEKLNDEECLDNCNEFRDRSDSFNQGGNDLHEPSLYECKTFLRKHGMRVSGTKEECIQRIKEHGRLEDGRGELLYTRSSFSINCTGDACRGDVVLFKQNMHNSQRNIIGRRTIAGRIVKESYGESTQHTFSVEVLWSEGSKKLNPLSILLVKGRIFYKFGTFRQPWESEEERSKVLREKHERGRAARHKRKLRETEFASGGNKGTKFHKVSRREPSQSKHITRIDKQNDVNKNTAAHNQAVWFQNMELKGPLQLTYNPDPNCSMCSNHDLQEVSSSFSYDRTLLPSNLLPCDFPGYSHYNNEQEGPNQVFFQPPDHHLHNIEPPVPRLTNKMGKSRFPRSSFSIKCKGDARVEDIVLFKQQVSLGGNKVGKKRTVAGRILKVHQCGPKDKHEFLIKVLWSKPHINLRSPFTLLVRSRNLYKSGTFRQPRKNEAKRSKMIKEKHVPATRKQKLKKTDIDSNKNKGAKRQKASCNGPSSSKQPTKIAKHKSSKRKGAGATHVKETKTVHKKKKKKKKNVQLQKTKKKKSKQQTFHPNPNPNLNPSVSTNPNLKPNSNPTSNTTSNPNPHTNTCHNTCANKSTNQYPNRHTNPNLHANQNTYVNKSTNSHPNQHANPDRHTCTNPDPHSNTCPNPSTRTNPNPHPNTHTNPNTCTNPHPNNYIYPAHQLPESSMSYGTTFMPNPPPPLGFSSNPPPPPPPVWLPPNQHQPSFGVPGYGGQWGPNHALVQPPGYYDHGQVIVQNLLALWLVSAITMT